MKMSNPSQDLTFREHLRQVHYWVGRFELSRDIEHYDTAERHAEVVKEYLPEGFQELTIIGLSNLHLILSPIPSMNGFEE